MAQKVTAIFDIGKTNKKFFLFNSDFQEVYREYITIPETVDEDNFPCEDLAALIAWMKEVFYRMLEDRSFHLEALNFSTYGASLVYLDANGNILTPLYNYLKPMDDDVSKVFYSNYGPQDEFSILTGSEPQGMLHSGLQLFSIKMRQPELFCQIKYALHLPQYLSYIFSGIPVSDHTSIGCHTALWDYTKNKYHQWVYAENVDKIFAPIVATNTHNVLKFNTHKLEVGVGIHDSSAALLPYLKASDEPFVLVSTGTWSVTMNPFSEQLLSHQDIEKGCVLYMQKNGNSVRSSKFLLGREYDYQLEKIADQFNTTRKDLEALKFNLNFFTSISNNQAQYFKWQYLSRQHHTQPTKSPPLTKEECYYLLISSLVLVQIESIKMAIGRSNDIQNIFVDGGFSENEIFMNILAHNLKGFNVQVSSVANGSGLGAAMVVFDDTFDAKVLKNKALDNT